MVKDLLVDQEEFWAKYRNAMPYLVNDEIPGDGLERRQSPFDRAKYEDTSRCILCAACTTACPVFWTNPDYVGPAAIVNAHRFIFDSRDTAHAERLELMADADGGVALPNGSSTASRPARAASTSLARSWR